MGRQAVAEQLAALSYGNQDISQWAGSGQNQSQELNGFWIDSSLKLSPVEQVQVLAEIFQGEPIHPGGGGHPPEDHAGPGPGGQQVYGKTGTGFGETSWFVGFTQENGQKTYFAVYLSDESREISGSDAKAVCSGPAGVTWKGERKRLMRTSLSHRCARFWMPAICSGGRSHCACPNDPDLCRDGCRPGPPLGRGASVCLPGFDPGRNRAVLELPGRRPFGRDYAAGPEPAPEERMAFALQGYKVLRTRFTPPSTSLWPPCCWQIGRGEGTWMGWPPGRRRFTGG